MRRILLSSMLASAIGLSTHAQSVTRQPGLPLANEPLSTATFTPGSPAGPGGPVILGGPACTGFDSLSTSSNIFTNIMNEANPIAADNATNSIVFLHRNNAAAFGGHSGFLRYDLSTNGGMTWSSNNGPVNPLAVNGTNGARYPNVAIYNPAGNTNPSNAYLSYMAATVAATWNGQVTGVRRLNGTANTENYNPVGNTQTYIPRSLVKGGPGVMWSIDGIFNGTSITGFRIYKGTWNGSTDFTWALNTTLNPTWNITYDGLPKNSDHAMAFDPTGTYGWIVILGHIQGTSTGNAFHPIFYRTTNGGQTWTGPEQIVLSDFDCLTAALPTPPISTTFDVDLTVDVNGNPHAIFGVAGGDNAYAVFMGNWHAIVGLTKKHGLWHTEILRNLYRGRATWGTAPNQVNMDAEPQISRSEDGTKIFYLWADADSSVTNPGNLPDLYGRAYDVTTDTWTASRNFTTCSPTFAGKALFPKTSETALSRPNHTLVPVVIARYLTPANDPLAVCSFQYLDSIAFLASDYTIPSCTTTVSLAASDTVVACSPLTLNSGVAGVNLWNTGATTQSITVTSSGWYTVTSRSNCCIGWDSVYVEYVVPPAASFTYVPAGLGVNFTNTSTGTASTIQWDFGDGNFSSSANPSHTYTAPGTYTVCLTITNACSTNTSCTNVNVVCAAPLALFSSSISGSTVTFTNGSTGGATSYSWDFGDGNSSSANDTTYTYTTSGTYNVCLIASSVCGADTLCQSVTVCVPVVAAWTVTAGTGPSFGFQDQSTGNATAWAWDFGDGNQSTLQNPVNVYGSAGTYIVCLTAMSDCDTNTFCDTIQSIIGNRKDALNTAFSVYPNPNQGDFSLVASDVPSGMVTIRLFNPLGQELWKQAVMHPGGAFNSKHQIGHLPSGSYLIRLTTEDGLHAFQKLLID